MKMTIKLVPWHEWDAANYARMLRHVDFRYLEDTYLQYRDDSLAKIHLCNVLRDEKERGDLYRAVMVEDELVGEVQVVSQEGVHSIDACLGCLLMKEYTGRGIGYEASRQIIGMAFAKNAFERLSANVYSPNKASIGMLEKLGFSREVTLRHGVYKDGHTYDVHRYGLLREEVGAYSRVSPADNIN